MARKITTPIQRFVTKFSVNTETGCWEWTAGLTGTGYGAFVAGSHKSSLTTAHRFSYLQFKGEIPDNLWVLHKCDNRRCVNPEHLFLGTHQDNMDDCVAKGRKKMSNYKRTYSKIHQDQVPGIRKLKGTATSVKISKQFNVNPQTIRDIWHGKSWKHVT